jgi:hypothetical protein
LCQERNGLISSFHCTGLSSISQLECLPGLCQLTPEWAYDQPGCRIWWLLILHPWILQDQCGRSIIHLWDVAQACDRRDCPLHCHQIRPGSGAHSYPHWIGIQSHHMAAGGKEIPLIVMCNVGHHGVAKSGGWVQGQAQSEQEDTNLSEISALVVDAFWDFAMEHRWDLRLEIKPGMYHIANAGALVTTIQDKVSFFGMA